ncbi:MAG: hypothetical protein JZU70_03710 [Chlorobium sp.]|jgi:hypothetical protein|nr:hypothetical protein [Chlorobium sp.]
MSNNGRNEEEEKALFSHRLEIRRIFIDKFLIGSFIALFFFIGNLVIEDYRRGAQKREFYTQKRIEAVVPIREAYTVMFDKFDSSTVSYTEKINNLPPEYSKLTDAFVKALAKWNVVLSDEFREEAEYQSWIFEEFNQLDFTKGAKINKDSTINEIKRYRQFSNELNITFDALCRQELGIVEDKKITLFKLEKWSKKKAEEQGAERYLQVNFKKWKQLYDK